MQFPGACLFTLSVDSLAGHHVNAWQELLIVISELLRDNVYFSLYDSSKHMSQSQTVISQSMFVKQWRYRPINDYNKYILFYLMV